MFECRFSLALVSNFEGQLFYSYFYFVEYTLISTVVLVIEYISFHKVQNSFSRAGL